MDGTEKKPLCVGLLAHVDAGKTTLSEALLYASGARRTLGRVDHADAFLDTHALERRRGITIFSKQALLETAHRRVTLVDTPGHVDFSPEAERVLPVLDCALLLISGTDGVQAHTLTLWQLLDRCGVPTFLFINKMDLPGTERAVLMETLHRELSPACVDFGGTPSEIAENAALCDEALLESYLTAGSVTPGNIRGLIAARKLFPCFFGSALRVEGVAELLEGLDTYAPMPEYPDAFGARVYKISRDTQDVRLTWLRVTGGTLKTRQVLRYVNRNGEAAEEKVSALRLYSGERYTQLDDAPAGTLCAAVGLTDTFAGQALGSEIPGKAPVLQSVMTCRIELPPGTDAATLLPKLRQLEEEEPQLQVLAQDGALHVRLMGRVQQEIFRSLVRERFALDIRLDEPRIFYKETIENTVEGIGHFEPLRHYAEVHLLLEPLPRGSGLVFAADCPTDLLDENYQNLILTHLAEKTHRGVLIGAPITDMRLTLKAGRAHLKHTEGGDMRQATYRAVRQGLMQAKSVLLEPWYAFTLTVPVSSVGRAITDIRAMSGTVQPPLPHGALATLQGLVPAAELGDYADSVAAYTQGRGRLQLSLHGYAPCHNPDAVIAAADYNPELDTENPPDSVFCAHGSGFTVKWRDVPAYMHMESCLKPQERPQLLPDRLRIDDKELDAILMREFGPAKRPLYRAPERRSEPEEIIIRPPRSRTLIVDGYNIIFSWDELAALAKVDLSAARARLCDRLASFASFRACRLIVVFDGYRVPGNPGEKQSESGIRVVYTAEGETADAYIEALTAKIGANETVRVATSDALVQLSAFRSGVLRVSARELRAEIDAADREMEKFYGTGGRKT